MSYRTAAQYREGVRPATEVGEVAPRVRAEEISRFSSFRIVVVVASRLRSRIPSFIRSRLPHDHVILVLPSSPSLVVYIHDIHVMFFPVDIATQQSYSRSPCIHVVMYPRTPCRSSASCCHCHHSSLPSQVINVRVTIQITQELAPREGPTVINALS
jgi:hypothetical protein